MITDMTDHAPWAMGHGTETETGAHRNSELKKKTPKFQRTNFVTFFCEVLKLLYNKKSSRREDQKRGKMYNF